MNELGLISLVVLSGLTVLAIVLWQEIKGRDDEH